MHFDTFWGVRLTQNARNTMFSSEKWHFQAKFSYLWVILTVFCGDVEYSTGPKNVQNL